MWVVYNMFWFVLLIDFFEELLLKICRNFLVFFSVVWVGGKGVWWSNLFVNFVGMFRFFLYGGGIYCSFISLFFLFICGIYKYFLWNEFYGEMFFVVYICDICIIYIVVYI